MNDQVKTRETHDQWWDSTDEKRDYSKQCSIASWNAALASVILPETMALSKVQRWSADNQSMLTTLDGEWVKYADVAGKIAVQEGVIVDPMGMRRCPSCETTILDSGFGALHSADCKYIDYNFGKGKFTSPLPSDGGLTGPTVWLFEVDEGEGDHEVEFVRKVDHLDIVAATEARAREDLGNSLIEANRVIQEQARKLGELRTELETPAKPGIEIPDVKDWPEWAVGIYAVFTESGHVSSLKDGRLGFHGQAQIVDDSYIPRPQPRKLTNEEMAEAWMEWAQTIKGPKHVEDRDDARAELFGLLVKGQSVSDLCAAAGISTESKE